MKGFGDNVKIGKSFQLQVEGVMGTFSEISLDCIYMFNDGKIEIRVRPNVLNTMNGGISFHENDFTPEQIEIRDAYINMVKDKVRARLETAETNTNNTIKTKPEVAV